MNAIQKPVVILFFALIFLFSSFGICNAIESALPGVYTLVEVNGKQLPAFFWANISEGKNCRSEVISGTLLLSSDGEWAGLLEQREICSGDGGAESKSGVTSELLSGTFEVSGDQIKIRFLGTESLGKISTTGNELLMHEDGAGQFEGQSLDYVLRRK